MKYETTVLIENGNIALKLGCLRAEDGLCGLIQINRIYDHNTSKKREKLIQLTEGEAKVLSTYLISVLNSETYS